MAHGMRRVLVCVLLISCGSSTDGGDAGGTGGGGESGSGGAGGAGGGGGASCMEREQTASSAIQEAVADADLSCTSVDECEIVSNSTDCHASCGVLVSTQGKADVEAAIADQNASTCAGFEEDGCTRLIPPCVPPGDFDCVESRCEWL